MSHCPAAAACRNINALWHDISDITVNNLVTTGLVTIIVLIASSTVATTASNLAAYYLVA